MLVVAENSKDARFIVSCIVICPAKMVPMVLLLAVLVASTSKIKSKPCFHLKWLTNIFGAIILIHRLYTTLFLPISSSLVIQHSIKIQPDLRFLCRLTQGQKILLGAPFCRSTILLLKLAKVVQIIDIISICVCSTCCLASRRYPQSVNPDTL